MPFVQPAAPFQNQVNNADQQLHLQFLRVGQGDSCVVKTPLGRVFLFDCGSINHGQDPFVINNCPGNIFDALIDPNTGITQGYHRLDGVIFSHPDRDHYNQIGTIAEWLHNLNWGITVENAFISLPPDLFDQGWGSNWLNREVYPWVTPINVTGITINQDTNPMGKFLIHWERLPDGREFKIEVIAAGVYPPNRPGLNTNLPNGDEKNTASIVTLMTFHNNKVLIMGDASTITGDFILTHFRNEISNLSVMHVPHHGSRRHTIKTTVWDVTMPDCTVISAPLRNDGDHLPAFETLDYADFLTAGATNPLNLPCFKYEGISPWQVFNPHGAPPQIDDEDMNGMLESYTIDSENSGKYNEIDRMQQRHPAYLMMQRTVYRGMGQDYQSQNAQLTYGVYSSSNDVWVTSAINGSIVFTYNGH